MDSNAISSRLLSGERLLWTGAPGQGLRLSSRDGLLIPFSLVWCGFAVFWEVSVLSTSRAPGFFPLWGLMFVCIGLYFVFGRFIVDALLRKDTQYALTDQRILIVRGGLFSKLTTLSLSNLPELRLSEGANARGTISFGNESAFGSRGFGVWSPSTSSTPQFFAIPAVRSVFDKIQLAARAEIRRP